MEGGKEPAMLGIVLGVSIALLIVAAIVALRPKQVRFRFEDREDYVVLEIERRIVANDFTLVTMSALREAVRLKLGSDYKRLVIHVRRARVAGEAAFRLLVGGLGPLFLGPSMKTAVVCGPKTAIGK